jgi:hypothetical protein
MIMYGDIQVYHKQITAPEKHNALPLSVPLHPSLLHTECPSGVPVAKSLVVFRTTCPVLVLTGHVRALCRSLSEWNTAVCRVHVIYIHTHVYITNKHTPRYTCVCTHLCIWMANIYVLPAKIRQRGCARVFNL